MTVGLRVPLAGAGLVALMVVVTVDRKNGFFNFNQGQGIENNLAVAVMAPVPGAFGVGRYSLDNAWHPLQWPAGASLAFTVILGLGGAAA